MPLLVADLVTIGVHQPAPNLRAVQSRPSATVAVVPPVYSAPVTIPAGPTPSSVPSTLLGEPSSLLGKIVFISNRQSPPIPPCHCVVTPSAQGFELWTMNPDGSDQAQLTPSRDGAAGDVDPTWSPDGRRLAWVVGNSATSYDIWSMNADGTDKTKLTPVSSTYQYPSWSPDGRRIAYVAHPAQSPDEHLWVMNADGSAASEVPTPGLRPTQARWSPDGRRLVFSVSGAPFGLSIVDLATHDVQSLRHGNASSPAWSPDGRTILFSDGNQILAIRPDGTGLRQLSTGPPQFTGVAWSRDGSSILVSHFAGNVAPPSEQVEVMRADGSGLRDITQAPGYNYDATF